MYPKVMSFKQITAIMALIGLLFFMLIGNIISSYLVNEGLSQIWFTLSYNSW